MRNFTSFIFNIPSPAYFGARLLYILGATRWETLSLLCSYLYYLQDWKTKQHAYYYVGLFQDWSKKLYKNYAGASANMMLSFVTAPSTVIPLRFIFLVGFVTSHRTSLGQRPWGSRLRQSRKIGLPMESVELWCMIKKWLQHLKDTAFALCRLWFVKYIWAEGKVTLKLFWQWNTAALRQFSCCLCFSGLANRGLKDSCLGRTFPGMSTVFWAHQVHSLQRQVGTH